MKVPTYSGINHIIQYLIVKVKIICNIIILCERIAYDILLFRNSYYFINISYLNQTS